MTEIDNEIIKDMVNIKTKRIAVIAGGILFTLVLLESALRLGGFIHLSIQEHRNLKSIKEKGEYRILCLGESTTMRQWPPFLEKILNKQDIGIKFAVIDKGMAGTNTGRILADLESNLDKYQPDMVITMMGINDEGYYKDISNIRPGIFKNLRIYKLAKLIFLLAENRNQKEETSLNSEGLLKKAQKNVPENEDELINLGHVYREQGKPEEAETYFRRAIEINPENDSAYNGLGWCLRDQDKYEEAETYFRRAIEINPENESAYVELGWCFREQSKYEEAESCFKRAIEINPEDKHGYSRLGWCFREQGKYEEAESYFKRAIEINPKNSWAYIELGLGFMAQGKPEEAERCYKRAMEINKMCENRYFGPMTVNNYLKLKEILDRRDIKYVCVQYPMWDVEVLKKIFEGQPDIIYVDNKKVFKEAVNKSNYYDYFIDIFGGNFGHCTNKGNKLLAENIARVILKEYFRK